MNLQHLKEKPFYLDEAEQMWVADTLGSMTEREKCGQLFVISANHTADFTEIGTITEIATSMDVQIKTRWKDF